MDGGEAHTGKDLGKKASRGKKREKPAARQRRHLSLSSKMAQALAQAELPYADLIFDLDEDEDYREIGRGASSVVYAGSFAGTPCAIKVFPGRGVSAQQLAAFWRECNLQRSLHSEQVVSVLGGALDRKSNGELRSMALVMERLQGTLADYLTAAAAAAPPPASQLLLRLQLLLDIAKGVRFLHACDIVHGDLKPANVLLGAGHRAKLADFGLARVRKEGTDATLSRTGQGAALGSPRYMDPCLHTGSGSLRKPSDVYAVGVLAWELLTGQAPYAGLELLELIRHVSLPICGRPSLEALPSVMASLGPLIARCWAPAQGDRPTAGEACRGIEEALERMQRAASSTGAAAAALPAEASALCVVCTCTEAQRLGCVCSAGHFTCRECMQGVAQMDAGPERVGELMGAVRCPWRGDIGAGTASSCPSQPWDLGNTGFANSLEPATLRTLTLAAQAALKVARGEAERLRSRGGSSSGGAIAGVGGVSVGGSGSGASAGHAGVGASPVSKAPSALPLLPSPLLLSTPLQLQCAPQPTPAGAVEAKLPLAASAPPMSSHLSPADFSERVRMHRQRLSEELLVLRCPRCEGAFFDYSGCAALQCGRPGCSAHFCALCPFIGTSRDVHLHLREPAHPGVGNGYDVPVALFNAYHMERRRLAVAEAVGRLQESMEVASAVWAQLCQDMGVPSEEGTWGQGSPGLGSGASSSSSSVLRQAFREGMDIELLFARQTFSEAVICDFFAEALAALSAISGTAAAAPAGSAQPPSVLRALDAVEYGARAICALLGGLTASYGNRMATLAARGLRYGGVCELLQSNGCLDGMKRALVQLNGRLGEDGEECEIALLHALAHCLAARGGWLDEAERDSFILPGGVVDLTLSSMPAGTCSEVQAQAAVRMCANVFKIHSCHEPNPEAPCAQFVAPYLALGARFLGSPEFAHIFASGLLNIFHCLHGSELQGDPGLGLSISCAFFAVGSRYGGCSRLFESLGAEQVAQLPFWGAILDTLNQLSFFVPPAIRALLEHLAAQWGAATHRDRAMYFLPALQYACALVMPRTPEEVAAAAAMQKPEALARKPPLLTSAQLYEAGLLPALVACQRAFASSLPASTYLATVLVAQVNDHGEPSALALTALGCAEATLSVLSLHCATLQRPAASAVNLLLRLLTSPCPGEAAQRRVLGTPATSAPPCEAAAEVLVDCLCAYLAMPPSPAPPLIKRFKYAPFLAACIGCLSSVGGAARLALLEAGALVAIGQLLSKLVAEPDLQKMPEFALGMTLDALGNLLIVPLPVTAGRGALLPPQEVLVSLACVLQTHEGNERICFHALRVLALCTEGMKRQMPQEQVQAPAHPHFSAAPDSLASLVVRAIGAHAQTNSGVLLFAMRALRSALRNSWGDAALERSDSGDGGLAFPSLFLELNLPRVLVSSLIWALASGCSGAVVVAALCLRDWIYAAAAREAVVQRSDSSGSSLLPSASATTALLEARAVEWLVSALQQVGTRDKPAVAEAAAGALGALLAMGGGGVRERAELCGAVEALVDVCWLFASFSAKTRAKEVLRLLGRDEQGVEVLCLDF